MNLMHEGNVVQESSISLKDLEYIKAFYDGTILPKNQYKLHDGRIATGAELEEDVEVMISQLRDSYTNMIYLFSDIQNESPTFLQGYVEPTPQEVLGIDVNSIADRLANRTGRFNPPA